MTKTIVKKELKEWIATQDQHEIIVNKYAAFNDPPHRYTKTRLCDMFNISAILFERYIARHKIKPKKTPKGYTKDFSKYKRVSVPCNYNCNTIILIHPDRCPIEAKDNYINRMIESGRIKVSGEVKNKKQDGNEYND